MEWSRAKTILLVVLICTNLFLAGNLLWQVSHGWAQQRRAMDQALALLQEDVGEFDEDIFRDLGTQRPVYAASRDTALEKKAAQALLGTEESDTDGGVSRFSSEKGTLTFYTGGEVRLELFTESSLTGEEWQELLEKAGFPMDNCRREEEGEQVVFFQGMPSGEELMECTLTCRTKGNGLVAEGRWLMDTQLRQVGEGAKSYQMVVSLRRLWREEGFSQPPESARESYRLRDQGNGNYLLFPVWQVEAGGKSFTVDTGENPVE